MHDRGGIQSFLLSLAGAWLGCALLLTTPLWGLDPDRSIHQYGHDRWDHMKGLPSQAIYDVIQTTDGYLWLHSGSGVLRFDGMRFVPVTPELEGKPVVDPVQATGVGASGDLLIRTETRTIRLSYLGAKEVPPYKAQPDGRPHTLLETRDGSIWIGTDNHIYRIRSGQMERIISASGLVSTMLEDHTGAVWTCTATALYCVKDGRVRVFPAEGFMTSVQYQIPMDRMASSGTRPRVINTAMEDSKGTLWVGARDGLWKVEGDRLVRAPNNAPVPDFSVSCLREDRNGNLWAGTEKSGLFRYCRGQWSNWGSRDGLSDDAVLCLREDREGSLWVGTRTGLDRLRDTPLLTLTTRDGLLSDNVYGVLEAKDGSLWLYGPEAGVVRLQNGKPTYFTARNGLASDLATTIFEARDGSIWVGTNHGLSQIHNGKVRNIQSPGHDQFFVSAISEDEESLIIAGADLNLYRLKNDKLILYDLKIVPGPDWQSVRYAFDIYRDPEGTHWFGLTAGLYRLRKGESPAHAERIDFPAPTFSVSDDGRGYVWVIGSQAIYPGFARVDKRTGQVFRFPPESGAQVDAMGRFLFDDQGNAWINSRKGLLVFQRKDLEDYIAGRIRTFAPRSFGAVHGLRTVDCGLSTAQPSSCLAKDGRLYFTSSKGLVVVDPRRLISNRVPPPVQIEEILANHKPLVLESGTVPPGTENLEIHYTALSMRIPSQVRFKYMLEGYDTTWVDADTRRTAFYTRLAPRTYRFRVIACNDEGLWNETGTSFTFTLKPRFYQTLWFYLLGFAGMGAIIYTIFLMRTRQMLRRQQELVALVDDRTKALKEEIRERTQAQESLIRYQDHLEHLISERTAELVRSNEMLAEEEQRYRLFFEEDVAGAFIATPDGLMLACNPAFARMLELPNPEAIVGKDLESFFPDHASAERVIQQLRREGKMLGFEIEMKRSNGKPLHIQANLLGQFSPNGHLVEIKGYVLDATMRRDLEEQLRQSQKMEAIGLLAGGVAHDFNNLLTVILGYSDLLMSQVTGRAQHLASGVREAGERAAALTRQLLAFSRRQVLQPKELDLNETVVPMEKMLRRLIGTHIKFELELSPEPTCIKADPAQIEQIILNLVVNARDAMPSGGRICMRTFFRTIDEGYAEKHVELKAGTYVCLSVQDSGCGMSPEVLARIFEPFFTTKGLGKGTGLGLSTVYGIVRQSGGFVEVESAPDQGSTFQVLLPHVASATISRPVPAEQPIPQGKETILVVEDDDTVLDMVHNILSEAGYRVLAADNGLEAMSLAEQEKGPIHLLLTDVVMPGMNGLEISQAQLKLRPGMRVLFMSGYMDEVLARFGESLGGLCLLDKPFTAATLLRRVREMLD